MSATGLPLSLLALTLTLLTACGGGTVLGERDGAAEADADEDRADADESEPNCGNNVVNLGEECDDGNVTPLDGCSSRCTLECGDGVLGPLEECDDGNRLSGDGCSLICTLECGDGRLSPGETCDDGNTTSHDGCSATCTLECGDGVLDPSEACDDGNSTRSDGCSPDCTLECGNGTRSPIEQCDDGNVTPGDGCSASCTLECGNGVVDPGEECDDGANGDGCDGCLDDCTAHLNSCGDGYACGGESCDLLDLGGETCASRGHPAGGMLRCSAACTFEELACRDPECGNTTCDPGETLAGCPSDCRDACGDGFCAGSEDQFVCPADCGAVWLSAGPEHACVVLADGSVRCWGDNAKGQLGNGATAEVLGPVRVTGIADVVRVEAGGTACPTYVPEGDCSVSYPCCGPPAPIGGTSCALLRSGQVRCWGNNGSGQLGDGSTTDSSVPVSVLGVADARSLAVAGSRACAVLRDGRSSCWGTTRLVSSSGSDDLPLPPSPRRGAVAPVELRLGEVHEVGWAITGRFGDSLYEDVHSAVVLRSDGSLVAERTVGCCLSGSLGGCVAGESDRPVVLASSALAVSIGIEWQWECAVLRDGRVLCGAPPVSPLAVVPALGGAVAVAVGARRTEDVESGDARRSAAEVHACALVEGGGVRCWGDNESGQLGDGTTTDRVTPVEPPGLLEEVTAVAAGGGYSCALDRLGAAWCWGDNESGQLGDGTTTNSAVPVQVAAW